ncbi:uncharacterized protein BDZ99DRAFT_476429 [Mytilinidion resinicola]|uniref:AA1-like domain-containing protein n=1 Tax=Mytilinidion resinicola TaxID=574789 RepID=A0A6A6YMY2_9PEZI|nr:uncharacterized protein BDZ99DRAFT_476429 [Mytilinidion resinicola]KAF2810246.1 hypothetical protein BDZ99DRAFT_476429 [Mytilinidion resinicola]
MQLLYPLLSSLLILPTLGNPINPRSTPNTASKSEIWHISAFTAHFMGDDSGLPGGEWPPGVNFNTTLSFTLAFPDNTTSSCAATFQEPGTPTAYTVCERRVDGSVVKFKVKKTEGAESKWAMYNFNLSVVREREVRATMKGSRHISSNTYAPETGVWCQQGGEMGISGPIPITAG